MRISDWSSDVCSSDLRMLIGGVIGDMHLGNASDFCCLFAYAAAALARDQQMHFAQLRGCSHDRQRCVLYRRIVMFNPNQRLHHATPRALSLPTSSSTSATLMPASRLGGSATFSVVRRGAIGRAWCRDRVCQYV